jgi:hypothetical protein
MSSKHHGCNHSIMDRPSEAIFKMSVRWESRQHFSLIMTYEQKTLKGAGRKE